MKKITGTLIWYYFVCKREVWFMAHEITPFQDDPFLEIGRIIHEHSYSREKKEIEAESMKFDIVKRRDSNFVIAEIKKSSRFLEPALMQLAFYLYRLEKQGLKMNGELLIPKEKKRVKVSLNDELKRKLEDAISHIKEIVKSEIPPHPKKIPFCKRCAYNEFCWA